MQRKVRGPLGSEGCGSQDIERSEQMNKGTGRLVSKDPRDRMYALPKRPQAAVGVVKRLWRSPGILDQGATSQCVVFSGDKYLTTRPITNKGFKTNEDRARVYKEVQAIDEWPGEDYDGTSVRAFYKWLKDKGFISEYRWAFDCESVVNHVLGTGPVQMGTIWDDGMSQPDRRGYISPTSDQADDSGHAWIIVGADREARNPDGSAGRVTMVNSWGNSWGKQGRAFLTFETLDRLIKMEGEAAVASEIKVAKLDLVGAMSMVA
jgi:C1A family cysteine protease